MSAAIIQFFFTMRDQIKLYHWSTVSYARHKATDEVIERLDKNIDRFTEVFIGKYSRMFYFSCYIGFLYISQFLKFKDNSEKKYK